MVRMGLIAAVPTLCAATALHAEGCNFPSTFTKTVDAVYQPRPQAGPNGPRIAGGIRIVRSPPQMLQPRIDTTIFVTPYVDPFEILDQLYPDQEDDEPPGPDLVEVRSEIVVDGAMFQQQLRQTFLTSAYWSSLTGQFRSCENRINNPDISLSGYSDRSVSFHLDVVVEKHVCGPFGTGFKAAGAHLHGPIKFFQPSVFDDGEVNHNYRALDASVGPFAISTSNEQDFFYNALQLTPAGIAANFAGYNYNNMKSAMTSTLNAHVDGQVYNITNDLYVALGPALKEAMKYNKVIDLGTGKEMDPFLLQDVSFVTGPTGGLAFKLSYELQVQLRRGEACSALRRAFKL